jgi:type III restriction enzyme
MLQEKVISAIAAQVDAWRGFPLGSAAAANPHSPASYEPRLSHERALSATTMMLLKYWFRPEPHSVGVAPHTRLFKYWPHQRRLVETFIYIHEVLGLRRTEALYRLVGVEPMGSQRDPWPKLGGQLATGSGKTKMMSLVIAWAYLNAVREPGNPLGLGQQSILIAPGLFVKDRLLQDFAPPDGSPSVFTSDPVVPPELEPFWNLKVYDPQTCPQMLDPEEGALVVTNYHQLLREREHMDSSCVGADERRIRMLFEDRDPQRLEAVSTPLLDRFSQCLGVLVLNDEAHHVWDEPGHTMFEQKARQRLGSDGGDAATAMSWIRSIRSLNGSAGAPGRVGLQVDLSATLFQETGTTTQTKKARKGGHELAEFKPTELFRHTVITYSLADAIREGIVKRPILEKVEVRNERTGEIEPLVRAGPNAWDQFRNMLSAGIARWRKVRDQLREEGDKRKPILFLLCTDKGEAQEVANYLTYREPVQDDLNGKTIVGYEGPGADKETLFVEKDADGTPRSTVVQIHIGQKEESNEAEWAKIRAQVNAIDRDEVPDPILRDESGRPRMLPNPYNVVISVMMLKEGWDVRNVKVIVPLRKCDSRTLTEQTLGRGLRKMHAPELDDEGAATMTREELYVIQHPSFAAVMEEIDDLVEHKSSDEIDHKPEYVAVPPRESDEARKAADVRLVSVERIREGARSWREDLDVAALPALAPRLPWHTEVDRTEIETRLRAALQEEETEGQRFSFVSEPSYRDFDRLIESAYVVPLLKELRVSHHHKTAVKDVVRTFLEKKTFAFPAGVPVRFDTVPQGDDALIALSNLSRQDVIDGVRIALTGPVHTAIESAAGETQADLHERLASAIDGFQAPLHNVIDNLKRSPFSRAAVGNPDELAIARLLEGSRDVAGWIYNDRHGVGYSIPYDWQGHTSQYFPDFVARAKWGAVHHNLIIEVKGRLDDKDKAKARAADRWCEVLSQHDSEPWHYVMLVENAELGRQDITWWRCQSAAMIEDVWRRHESLPLIPETGRRIAPLAVVPSVPLAERYGGAVPVRELRMQVADRVAEAPIEPSAWARIAYRPLDPSMFVARIESRAMEPGVPGGSWGLFRRVDPHSFASPLALDGRRLLVQVALPGDPETGLVALRRWRVTCLDSQGQAAEIALRPDDRSGPTHSLKWPATTWPIVAELLEVVG